MMSKMDRRNAVPQSRDEAGLSNFGLRRISSPIGLSRKGNRIKRIIWGAVAAATWFARPTQTNFDGARVSIADNIAFRYSPIVSDPVKYITDDRGERTAVVVPIADYEKLLEDLEDLAVVAERREEPTIPHEQFVSELKRDGLL